MPSSIRSNGGIRFVACAVFEHWIDDQIEEWDQRMITQSRIPLVFKVNGREKRQRN
jgi:hypothetical protein